MAGWYSSHSSQQKPISSKLKNIDPKGCVHFRYEDLAEATDQFNQKPQSDGGRKLGEGGFGPVFLGDLRSTKVAVKGISKRARVNEIGTTILPFLNVMWSSLLHSCT
jgi:hypothetical protein